ncbi:putative membrane protein [Clostridium argentinense CDC 2741]|uniref:Putative membrane protein n=1 Tax=Clostridium argentinense CDC 2741 TaxID=1418104 RepID=A0A0C1UMU6_9CLOT|nr:hypothetical protein [Clostridium argentinense]ARC83247.1 hypothetical protein RSJ17_00930 [Clostridium argentinense]KIE48550.1 putative membrane protein [Clostridium argentinense CDC 2741]NFF41871.1 hypothetical protein [Clostridium argentinense]NFP52557.1 hypothetical protein [Clostridium argentinense]NFP74927.1 hypothetical protein [Clostridium argentinense]
MKKVLTTIIITLIFLCLGGVFIYSSIEEFIIMNEFPSDLISKVAMIFMLIFGIILVLALVYNMIERIKEIKRGDEDDISKY